MGPRVWFLPYALVVNATHGSLLHEIRLGKRMLLFCLWLPGTFVFFHPSKKQQEAEEKRKLIRNFKVLQGSRRDLKSGVKILMQKFYLLYTLFLIRILQLLLSLNILNFLLF